MFYNTTQEKGNDLKEAKIKASKQDKSILESCKELGVFTATKLWKHRNGITMNTTYQELIKIEPLTSVRRALNTLEKEGLVEVVCNTDTTPVKFKSDFNRNEFFYQVS